MKNPDDIILFATPAKLAKRLKNIGRTTTESQAAQLIKSEAAITLSKQEKRVSRSIPKRFIDTPPIAGISIGADLVYARSLKFGGVFSFILTVLDLWTRRIYLEPIASSKAVAVTNAFKKILSRAPRIPEKLFTDR